MDEKSLQLLKVMREQLGETAASRSVDAVAAASSLGMYPETLDLPRNPRPQPALFGPGRIPRGVRRPRHDHAGAVPDYLPGYSCDRQRLASSLLQERLRRSYRGHGGAS